MYGDQPIRGRTRGRLPGRLGRRLLSAISVKRTKVGEAGLEVPGLGTVAWCDVLTIFQSKETWRAIVRTGDSDQQTVYLGRLSKEEADRLRATWEAELVAVTRQHGFFEGTTVSRLDHQGGNAAFFLILGLTAVVLLLWLLSTALPRLTPLLPPAQIWYYLTPLVAGAILISTILLGTAYSYWRDLHLTCEWRRWRIDRNGLSVPSPAGGWILIRFAPRDRVGDSAVIGGGPVPVGLFSGGELTSKLLIGLAQRHAVAIGPWNNLRNTALRCLLLWCPLLAAGWLVFFQLTGQPIHTAHWMILGFGGALFVWIGVGFLWIHVRFRKRLHRLTADAEELIRQLGW